MPKCFSCPGDCKELSKRLSEAYTTGTKPGPCHGRPDQGLRHFDVAFVRIRFVIGELLSEVIGYDFSGLSKETRR